MSEENNKLLEQIIAIKTAYQNAFRENEAAAADLRAFCRVDPTRCFDTSRKIDPMQLAVMEGRRQVFDRIDMFLNTPIESLINIYQTTKKE